MEGNRVGVYDSFVGLEEVRHHLVPPPLEIDYCGYRSPLEVYRHYHLLVEPPLEVLFVALIVTVTYLYAVDIYTKFLDNATTFKSKIEKTKYSIMPPITICMENGLKRSVMKKYELGNIMEFHYDVENLTSVWDTFFEASYIINRDFKI